MAMVQILFLSVPRAPPSVNLGLDILAKKGKYVQVEMFPMAEIFVDFDKII